MLNTDLITKSRDLARKIHEGQKRISGDLFFDHVSGCAELLYELGIEDENTLCAAYLHHALDVEKPDLIEREFNKEVLQIIQDYKILSDGHFSNIDPSNINEDLIIQTYFNLAKNPKTLLIRMADKVDNIKTAHKLPKEQAQKVAERALYIYSPICKLIGLNKFVGELEDSAFKILNPKEFYKIDHYIKSNYPRIKQEIEEIKDFLLEIFKEVGIGAEIETRIKGVYSSYTKLKRYFDKGWITKKDEYRGLYDYVGLRILVNTEEECYKCEDLLNKLWDQIPNTRDDYISRPKPNGYKTLQSSYIVSKKLIIEVQMRTHEMHEYNEYGQASHALYKIGEMLKGDFAKNPDLLKDISYTINREKIDIGKFSRFVYVYTPKGDIKKLPKGANLLDFAYSLHKDIGNTAIGGEVNGEFKPLEFVLNDGDRVFIKMQKQKKAPSQKFIELVKTSKAREEIRKALRAEKR